MRIRADATGVASTAGDDPRITRIGKLVRRLKLDELTQLWNVLLGEMSVVGPRPQVLQDVEKYTAIEQELLNSRPGITDLASIVFADESEILRGAADPDKRYDEIIRPWKSRLALLYVTSEPRVFVDATIILLTALALVSRTRALRGVSALVEILGGGPEVAKVALRVEALRQIAPPSAIGDIRC